MLAVTVHLYGNIIAVFPCIKVAGLNAAAYAQVDRVVYIIHTLFTKYGLCGVCGAVIDNQIVCKRCFCLQICHYFFNAGFLIVAWYNYKNFHG